MCPVCDYINVDMLYNTYNNVGNTKELYVFRVDVVLLDLVAEDALGDA